MSIISVILKKREDFLEQTGVVPTSVYLTVEEIDQLNIESGYRSGGVVFVLGLRVVESSIPGIYVCYDIEEQKRLESKFSIW